MLTIEARLRELFKASDMTTADQFCHIVVPYHYTFHDRDKIKDQFLAKMSSLKNGLRFYVLVDHTCHQDRDHPDKLILTYQLLNMESHFRLQLSIYLQKNEFMISFRELWPSIIVMEKELHDNFGIHYFISRSDQSLEGARDNKPYMLKGNVYKHQEEAPPLPEFVMPLKPSDVEADLQWQSVGPFGDPYCMRQRMDILINDQVGHVEQGHLTFGFHQRFIEKKSEALNFFELEQTMMRLSREHSLFYSLVFVEAIEKMALVTVPVKAQVLRMILCELARIRSHVSNLTKFLSFLGFDYESHLMRQSLNDLYLLDRAYAGKNQLHSPFIIGGLRTGIPDGWVTDFFSTSKKLSQSLQQMKSCVNRHPDMIKLCQRNGLSAHEALDYALSGPSLRSCGVSYDLRKKRPSYLYEDIDFEVPLGINGTNYDRFIVRTEETYQSMSMIHQLLNSLPRGTIYNREHAYHRPYLKSQKEDSTSRSYYSSSLPDLPRGELYHYIEGPEGEIGLYLTSTGQKHPERLHVKSPSLSHGQIFTKLTKGLDKQNCFLSLIALNIDSWEVDR